MFAYCDNCPVSRLDPEGTDWKTWVGIGLGLLIVGVAIIAAAPTGGGSLLLAEAGLDVATTVAIGKITAVAGTAVAVSAMANGKQQDGGHIDINKETRERVDWEYNGNDSGNVHFEKGSDQSSKVDLWRMRDGKGSYAVTREAIKLLANPKIQKAVEKGIYFIKNPAGLK